MNVGFVSGQVEVLERVKVPSGKSGRRGPYFRCKCHRCGNTSYIATSSDLYSGRISSCGCYRNSQEFANEHIKHGHSRRNKGETSAAYKSWCEMKRRCDSPQRSNYKYYGGRGIKYDESWAKFENFLADMGEPPQGYELDRKDNSQGYKPSNCRWATHKENCQNRRPREPKLP